MIKLALSILFTLMMVSCGGSEFKATPTAELDQNAKQTQSESNSDNQFVNEQAANPGLEETNQVDTSALKEQCNDKMGIYLNDTCHVCTGGTYFDSTTSQCKGITEGAGSSQDQLANQGHLNQGNGDSGMDTMKVVGGLVNLIGKSGILNGGNNGGGGGCGS